MQSHPFHRPHPYYRINLLSNTPYLFVIIVLIVAIGFLLVLVRDLNVRVKRLTLIVERLRLQERTQLSHLEEAQGKKTLTREEQLFVDLCKLMDTQRPFTNPNFKVDDLAKAMNTNRTYLANAIRTYADGLTIQAFIMRYRLRYAASLLELSNGTNINEISEHAGFASRSTFNRQFFNFYGFTPSECKARFSRQRIGDMPTIRENTLEK